MTGVIINNNEYQVSTGSTKIEYSAMGGGTIGYSMYGDEVPYTEIWKPLSVSNLLLTNNFNTGGDTAYKVVSKTGNYEKITLVKGTDSTITFDIKSGNCQFKVKAIRIEYIKARGYCESGSVYLNIYNGSNSTSLVFPKNSYYTVKEVSPLLIADNRLHINVSSSSSVGYIRIDELIMSAIY